MGSLTKDWNKKRAAPPKKSRGEIKESWLSRKSRDAGEWVKSEYKHKMAVRKAEREAYKEAELAEAKKFGKQKAALETKRKLKSLKTRGQSYEFRGFAGPTQRGTKASTGMAELLIGKPSKKKKKESGIGDMRLF